MSGKPWRIVFAPGFDASAIERARTEAEVVVLDGTCEDVLVAGVADCDALLVRTSASVTRRVIEAAPRLRVIGRGGAGLDNIDLDAAKQRDITVVHTPDASTDAVADLTVGMMIALVRRLGECDEAVRAGRFEKLRATYRAAELKDLMLGIIGMGRIGKAAARRCAHGFGMRVLYNDIVEVGTLDFDAEPAEKAEVYARSDVVSLHVPLTELTRSLIDAEALARFKERAFLINTARGAVVDTHVLAAALESGRLAGAALDVTDPEPLRADHPLLWAPNTLFSPHIAARTPASLSRMNAVVDKVLLILEQGEKGKR